MIHTVYLGLGSNLGDREKNLSLAVEQIGQKLGEVFIQSSVIETPAWGLTDLPDYLNMTIGLHTCCWPLDLMQKILNIENELGRVRTMKWDSRIIDIDLLFFNNWHFHTPSLQIPHPYIPERDFVKIPLREIAPDLIHPVLRMPVSKL